MISKSAPPLSKPKPDPIEVDSAVTSPPLAPPSEHGHDQDSPPESPRAPAARSHNSPRPNRWSWIVGMIVRTTLLVVGCAGIYYGRPYLEKIPLFGKTAAKPVKPPQRVVTVVTAPVRRGNMNIFLNGLGTITAYQTVTVRSRVEGELIRVAFREGQMVNEGDLLAEIDSRPFLARLQQAEGQLIKDEAMVRGARLTLERNQKLLATQTVTAQQIDEQIALLGQAEGAVLADKAIIEDAKLQVTYSKILAPISGRIGLRLIDQGNIVRANDPTGLAVITQLQPITMTFTVPQDDIARVQSRFARGDGLMVDAYNRDFDMKLASGRLLAIDNQVDVTTGTVRLKAIFKNEDNMLFPNQFVNARLFVDEIQDAVIVPTAAVQHGPDFDFVYVVKDDETVDLQVVKTGVSEGDSTVISTGLANGQTVVTGGMDKLQRGSKVAQQGKGKPSGDSPKHVSGKDRGASETRARGSE